MHKEAGSSSMLMRTFEDWLFKLDGCGVNNFPWFETDFWFALSGEGCYTSHPSLPVCKPLPRQHEYNNLTVQLIKSELRSKHIYVRKICNFSSPMLKFSLKLNVSKYCFFYYYYYYCLLTSVIDSPFGSISNTSVYH